MESTTERYERIRDRNDRRLAQAGRGMIAYVLRTATFTSARGGVCGAGVVLGHEVRAFADALEIDAVLREVTA